MIGKVKFVTDRRKCCMNGWAGTKRKPACNYTGGHFCNRSEDHTGRCRCQCGATGKNRYLCSLCKQVLSPVGYHNRRILGSRVACIVFRCGCDMDFLSCVTRAEYMTETGRNIKYKWKGGK